MMTATCPEYLEKAAIEQPDNTLFSRGVPRRPQCPAPPPPMEQWVGKPPADGATATGVAYTDGALRGTVPKARRGGWAFVVDNGAEPIWGKYGSCSDVYLTVLRTELRALVEVLRITTGPITIFVDNAQVVDGIPKGREWCCSHKRDGADLWRQIWDRLEELEGVVSVQKVKAHLSYGDVVEGRTTWSKWVGNGVADLWAKRGSAVAERLSPSSWIHAEWSRACAYYKWAVLVAAEWEGDTETKELEKEAPIAGSARPRGTGLINARSHELWRNLKKGWCRLCGIESQWTGQKPPPAFRRPCRGSMGQRCKITGRERGMSPRSHTFDEGRIPMATLHAHGAERVMHMTQPHDRSSSPGTTGPGPPLGGHARGESSRSSEHEGLQPHIIECEEDDPFGHLLLAMDFDDRGLSAAVAEPQAEQPAAETGRAAHASHTLTRFANLVWCKSCGRHAIARLGAGLLGPCKGSATGGYPTRIARMRRGLHPMTGQPFK